MAVSVESLKMDGSIKEKLIKSVKAIKSKVKQIKDDEDELDLKQNKFFKTIINPLQTIATYNGNLHKNISDYKSIDDDRVETKIVNVEKNDKNQHNTQNQYQYVDKSDNLRKKDVQNNNYELNKKQSILSPLIEKHLLEDDENISIPFGIRSDNDRLMIGNTPATFSTISDADSSITTFIKIGNTSYEITPGLTELLLRKNPKLNLASESDKLIYKDILLNTNVHKRDYNPGGQIKGDKGKKYTQLIRPLLNLDGKHSDIKHGGNIPLLKKYKKNTDLIYWDDPNELVERLKLLTASKDAGNSNHDNEIISIIEELKEAGIIKV